MIGAGNQDGADNRMFIPDGTLCAQVACAAETPEEISQTAWDKDNRSAVNAPQMDGLSVLCPEQKENERGQRNA